MLPLKPSELSAHQAREALPQSPSDDHPRPSRRSRFGLDFFVFFVADVQTGFGPFVSSYLTGEKWTLTDIGLVLTVGGIVTLLAQIPAGAALDAVRSVRALAAVALVCIGVSAFALAALPIFPVVMASRVIQAAASCVLGVAMASISLNMVGRLRIGSRLGRNAAFASAGTGLAAAGMGIVGYYVSTRAVFYLAAGLSVPALVALACIRPNEVAPIAHPDRTPAHTSDEPGGKPRTESVLSSLWRLAHSRTLVIFAICVVLFQMANASMLPLAASILTLRSNSAVNAPLVAAAIVVPQLLVTILSPFVGLKAESWGRRKLLLIGFAVLPLRGLLFAWTVNPRLLVAVQALDGISAAVIGVLTPLIIADVAGRSGRFNLAQGTVGCAVGIGASISTTAMGAIADVYGAYTAFLTMAIVAGIGLSVVFLFMPETAPNLKRRHRRRRAVR